MLLNSEIIVGLWVVPVVLFIFIPLSMLCIWSCVQFLKKFSGNVVKVQKSVMEADSESYGAGLRSGSAA